MSGFKQDAETYYNRGREKFDIGDYHGAIEDFTRAIEIDPFNGWAYSNRGFAKLKLNDFSTCLDDINKGRDLVVAELRSR